MMRTLFAKWFSPHGPRPRKRDTAGRPARRPRWRVPRLEHLEDRLAPAGVSLFQQWSNVNVAWQNGNLNANQATLFEGDSVPYRAQFSGLTPGATYVYTITWQTTNAGQHALDYLTSFDYTWNGGSGSGTSVDGHALDGSGLASSTPFTTFQIPTDPNINSGPASNFMINGRTPVGSPTNPPNQFFTIYGATLDGAFGYTTYAMTGNTFQSISIEFTTAPTASVPNPVSNPVLVWGGHIASQLDWGLGTGAASISGSPYHMIQTSLTENGTTVPIGSPNLALQAAAVTSPTIIVVNKAADPTVASAAFDFANNPDVFFVPGQPANFVNSFSLDGSNTFNVPPYTLPGSSGENVWLLQTTTFGSPTSTQITEAPLPAGWTLTNIMIHSRIRNTTTTQSGPTASLNCVQGDTLWVTFTDTFSGSSSTATTIVDAATGNPLTGNPAAGTPGEPVRDTAVVTFSPAASTSTPTPTGTVKYTFTGAELASLTVPARWDQAGQTGLTTWTDTVTLNAAGTIPPSANTPALPPGSYQFTASYSGDNNFTGSTSRIEPLTIRKASSSTATTIVHAAPTPPPPGGGPTGIAGESVFDTATVTGASALFTPTGTLIYTFSGPQLATLNPPPAPWTEVTPTLWSETVTLNADGTAPPSAATPGLPVGNYTFRALYFGDSNYTPSFSTLEPLTIGPASPMLTTAPNVTTVELGPTTPPVLKDTADLEGGFNPTGSITFELFQGGTLVHTETVTVRGDGIYTTPMGFTLPTSGTVAGTYQWVASYSGDPNNNPTFTDTNADEEKVTVLDPTPTLVTTASPAAVTRGPDPVTLTDTATLSGGFHPTGDIVFELFHTGGSLPVFVNAVNVNGNGPYATAVTLPPTALVAGTYQWVVVYSGDPNNTAVGDSNPGEEQVTVPPQADLAVTKAVSNPTPAVGDTVAFVVTVTNHGPDTATGVIVVDPLPAGLAFVSYAASQGAYDASSGVWFVGTLPAGATAFLRLDAFVAVSGPLVNVASAGGDQFDPDPSNNQDEAVVVGVPPSPEVSKGLLLASSLSAPADPSLLAPATPNQRFVAQLYRDLLGREPDVLGLVGWGSLLDQGASRAQVALAVEDTPEYRGDQVAALYLNLLHRPPDPAAAGFVNFLLGGGTLEQVQAMIAGSPEYFLVRGGGSAPGFLSALFQDALGRPIDPQALAGGLQGLAAGMSPTQVADVLFRSAEYDADLVGSYYRVFLRRPADPGGLQAGVGGLLGGLPAEDVLAGILGSPEYLALA